MTTMALHANTIDYNRTLFKVKDPVSAGTHFIGLVAAIIMMPVILVHSAIGGADLKSLAAISIFMMSMILLYGASASYHAFDLGEKANLKLKKMDHSMICVLIAGTYTPVCIIGLEPAIGLKLLAGVWAFAIMGILFKMFWVTCPKWISSVIYIAMGWLCVFALPSIYRGLSGAAFGWLLAGGIFYTVGGVIYAMKFEKLNNRFPGFGNHEIFHLFVMAGSLCQFITVYMFY